MPMCWDSGDCAATLHSGGPNGNTRAVGSPPYPQRGRREGANSRGAENIIRQTVWRRWSLWMGCKEETGGQPAAICDGAVEGLPTHQGAGYVAETQGYQTTINLHPKGRQGSERNKLNGPRGCSGRRGRTPSDRRGSHGDRPPWSPQRGRPPGGGREPCGCCHQRRGSCGRR